jgi:hypothetical protein
VLRMKLRNANNRERAMDNTDELAFLRGVEQDVQLLQSYLPAPNQTSVGRLTVQLKRKINARIIELLERREASAGCCGKGPYAD